MKNLIVKKSKIEGFGVFADRNFRKGEVVIKWEPKKIVSKASLKKLSKKEQIHTTPTENGNYVLMGVPERYVNHSCNPNTYTYNNKDIAITNIKKGDEITSDYSINGIDKWKIKCNCKNKKCRKFIYGDFFKLPINLRKKYYKYLDKWFKHKFKNSFG